MTPLRKIWLSIIRQKRRTIGLFLVSLVIFSVLTGAFLINKASTVAIDYISKGTEAIISLNGSFSQKLYETYKSVEVDYSYNERIKYINDVVALLKELEQDERVNYVDYQLTMNMTRGTVCRDDDMFYEPIAEAVLDGTINEYLAEKPQEAPYLISSTHYSEGWPVTPMDMIALVGEEDPNTSGLRYGKFLDYSNGRTFSQQEIDDGSFVCLVPSYKWTYIPEDELGNYRTMEKRNNNSVSTRIGHKIILTSIFTKDGQIAHVESYQFEVVGVYAYKQSALYSEYDDKNDRPIIVPNKAIEKIMENNKKIAGELGCEIMSASWCDDTIAQYPSLDFMDNLMVYTEVPGLKAPVIELKKVEYISEIMDIIQERLAEYPDLKIKVSTEEYENIAGPVKNLKSISQMVLYITGIISTIVLSLIIILETGERKHELGIFMSMGERKKQTVMRTIMESVIICSLAFVISIGLGTAAADKISDKIIFNNNPKPMYKASFIYYETTDLRRQYKVELTAENVLAIASLVYGIVLVSSLTAAVTTVRLNPKEVMLGDQ